MLDISFKEETTIIEGNIALSMSSNDNAELFAYLHTFQRQNKYDFLLISNIFLVEDMSTVEVIIKKVDKISFLEDFIKFVTYHEENS